VLLEDHRFSYAFLNSSREKYNANIDKLEDEISDIGFRLYGSFLTILLNVNHFGLGLALQTRIIILNSTTCEKYCTGSYIFPFLSNNFFKEQVMQY